MLQWQCLVFAKVESHVEVRTDVLRAKHEIACFRGFQVGIVFYLTVQRVVTFVFYILVGRPCVEQRKIDLGAQRNFRSDKALNAYATSQTNGVRAIAVVVFESACIWHSRTNGFPSCPTGTPGFWFTSVMPLP